MASRSPTSSLRDSSTPPSLARMAATRVAALRRPRPATYPSWCVCHGWATAALMSTPIWFTTSSSPRSTTATFSSSDRVACSGLRGSASASPPAASAATTAGGLRRYLPSATACRTSAECSDSSARIAAHPPASEGTVSSRKCTAMVFTSSGMARAWSSTMRPTTICTASLRMRQASPDPPAAATTTTCGRCSIMNLSSRSRSTCCRLSAALPPALRPGSAGAPGRPPVRTAMLGASRKSTSSPAALSMVKVVGGFPSPYTAASTRTSTSSSAYSSSARTSGRQGARAMRRQRESPHSLRTATRDSRSMASAASRVSPGARIRRTASRTTSLRSAFHASAISLTSSRQYAWSISEMSSAITASGSAIFSCTSPSRCALSAVENSAPENSDTGLACRRLTPAAGWKGSSASTPAGVGCVHTQHRRRTVVRNQARTLGSTLTSAAATCTSALSTSAGAR
mmetsp:Transcript_16534/g.40691  ORF Transcript_16534/g.40691 Transcript_16534/m.40691 type:complete len:457 (-) Transcript_16534:3165-4535(-)